jgi:hypothetical protein
LVFQSREDNIAMNAKNKVLTKPGHTTIKQEEKERGNEKIASSLKKAEEEGIASFSSS